MTIIALAAIAIFVVGVIKIVRRQWETGAVLIVLAIALPTLVSFLVR